MKKIINRQILILIFGMLFISIGVVWWYVKPNTRALKSAEQVFEIAEAIRKSYIAKPDYWGLDNNSILSKNILTNIFYKDGRLVNALGKPIAIGQGIAGEVVMPGGRSFDIVYSQLTAEECIILATYYNYESEKVLGLLQMTIVGNDTSQDFSWGDNNYKLPISRAAAKKICQNDSKVLWTVE